MDEIQPRAIVAEPYERRAKLLFWLKKDGHKNEIFHQPGQTRWHTPDEWPIPIAEEDPDSDSDEVAGHIGMKGR